MTKFYRNRFTLGDIPQLDVVVPEYFPINGLVSYYPFESNCNDIKGTNNGSPSGITYTPGKKGNGATIIADNAYISIPNISGSNLSVVLWYKFNGVGSGDWNTLLARSPGTYHHLLIKDSDRVLGFYNASFFPSSKALVVGQTYCIIITKVGTNQKIYVDNELVLNSNSSFDNNSYPLSVIGNCTTSGGNQGTIGIIDEMAIYNRELTEEERTLIWNAGNGNFYTS